MEAFFWISATLVIIAAAFFGAWLDAKRTKAYLEKEQLQTVLYSAILSELHK